MGAEVVNPFHQHHSTLERMGTRHIREGGALSVAVAVLRTTKIGIGVVQEVGRLLQDGNVVRPDTLIGWARPMSDGCAGADFEQQLVRSGRSSTSPDRSPAARSCTGTWPRARRIRLDGRNCAAARRGNSTCPSVWPATSTATSRTPARRLDIPAGSRSGVYNARALGLVEENARRADSCSSCSGSRRRYHNLSCLIGPPTNPSIERKVFQSVHRRQTARTQFVAQIVALQAAVAEAA